MKSMLCVLLGLFGSVALAGTSTIVTGKVTVISDGDTLHVEMDEGMSVPVRDGQKPPLPGSRKMKIRMSDMDTPELHISLPGGKIASQGKYAELADARLKQLLPLGTRVSVVVKGVDVHGRTLAHVMLNGRDVNLQMVEEGHAIPYVICDPEQCSEGSGWDRDLEPFYRACEVARREGRGIFNKKEPLQMMPFEFRLKQMNRTADKYVGDVRTQMLVQPAEYSKVDLCRRAFFPKLEDAEAAGYRLAN
jgi:endonuclease YncB( thermonuclease family)